MDKKITFDEMRATLKTIQTLKNDPACNPNERAYLNVVMKMLQALANEQLEIIKAEIKLME